jgi:hypothetical protein
VPDIQTSGALAGLAIIRKGKFDNSNINSSNITTLTVAWQYHNKLVQPRHNLPVASDTDTARAAVCSSKSVAVVRQPFFFFFFPFLSFFQGLCMAD